MTINISGPGVGIPRPTNLYPTQLANAPADASTNYITLNAGDAFTIPAGQWLINFGKYSVLQYLDPVNNAWRIANKGQHTGTRFINSDGFSFRVANLTGCPVAAQVVAGGSGYAQATTSITAVGGATNSTWQPIVGGALSVISVAAAGKGYGMPPVVLIAAPPTPGIQATGYATLTAGSVTGVTLTNVGAGYTSVPAVQIVPSPADPNFIAGSTISTATVSIGTVNPTAVTGAICTNPGAALTTVSALTLTVGGAGTAASVAGVVMQVVTSVGIVGAGVGYTSNANALRAVSVGGGVGATSTYTNPEIEMTNFVPRSCEIVMFTTASSVTSTGSTVDAGLFLSTPTAAMNFMGAPTAAASLVYYMGSTQDTVMLQPT